MKSIYTEPKIANYGKINKSWFVYFRYNKKLFKRSFGINYIKDLKERKREFEALREAIRDKLKEGWNPLLPEDVIVQQNKEMTLLGALSFALEKKKPNLSKKSYLGYKGTVCFCQKAIKNLRLENLLITEVKRIHIKLILEKIKETRKWSNYAYNKNLGYLQAVLSELLQWEILEFNPAHNIKNLKVAETKPNIPPNPEQHQIIKQKLQSEEPNFYLFIITIFHTGIRPEELTKITLEMVDVSKGLIVLPPEIQKTKQKERIVPINSRLLQYFKALNLHKYPSDYYLFGRHNKNGGRGLNFIPAPFKIKRDTATKKWKEIVKDELGIPVNMYAMKHFGADQKILAGIDLDALRELYGHGSKLMTMKYAKAVKEVYRKEIMEKSPDF